MKDVHHDSKLGEFLDALLEELQFRGSIEQVQSSSKDGIKKPIKGRALAVSNKSCVYCSEEHEGEKCTKVKDYAERKRLIIKYKRCFQCLGKGHQVKDCKRKKACSNSGKFGHHISICKMEQHQSATSANLHVTVNGSIA